MSDLLLITRTLSYEWTDSLGTVLPSLFQTRQVGFQVTTNLPAFTALITTAQSSKSLMKIIQIYLCERLQPISFLGQPKQDRYSTPLTQDKSLGIFSASYLTSSFLELTDKDFQLIVG